MTRPGRWFLLAAAWLPSVTGGPAAAAEPASELDGLLARLDRSAARYARTALSFTCEETIRWEGRRDHGRRKFAYVVTRREDGTFEDYRTPARKRKKTKRPKRVVPTDRGVLTYLRSAWLWIFVFKRDRWPHHRYEIVGREERYGRPATAIRFEPLPPFRVEVNNWFGTAWVDDETAQLLRVEAHRPEDEKELRKIERHAGGEAASEWVYVVEEITTEFTIEKRGLRFPGRVELRHDGYDFRRGLRGWNMATHTILRVDQLYSDYEFFEVETTTNVDP